MIESVFTKHLPYKPIFINTLLALLLWRTLTKTPGNLESWSFPGYLLLKVMLDRISQVSEAEFLNCALALKSSTRAFGSLLLALLFRAQSQLIILHTCLTNKK